MSSLTHLLKRNLRNSNCRLFSTLQQETDTASATPAVTKEFDDDEFRVLNLRAVKQNAIKKREIKKEQPLPPRNLKMATDQDWAAVWPGPRSFHPATVPLPLRQGFTVKSAAPPGKYANAELMKIPNFLHLTPPAIKQQCEALKQFCSPWPKGLETEPKWKLHFPIEVIYSDYCHALPTIRQPEARRVTLRLKLSDLKFDAHARDKFLRLVGDRYDRESDTLIIDADRCPLRKQNYDYALYLLTACYHEAFITEPWETTKSEADMEYYYFERNVSKVSAENILNWGKAAGEEKIEPSKGYAQSVEQLINEGENEYNIAKYKKEVLKMLGLKRK